MKWLMPLLLLLGFAFFAGLRGPALLASFPAGTSAVDVAALAGWWEADTDCLDGAFPAGDTLTALTPAANSTYTAGLSALSQGDLEVARGQFRQAVAETEHPLALVLLANMATQDGQRPVESAIYSGPWNDEMRLELARYYFWLAGRCHVARAGEDARRYVAWGEAYLPPGRLADVELILARRVTDVYLADGDWAAALPWLEHAAQANDSSLLQLSRAYYELGQYEQALESYERALLYYPDHVSTRLGAARAARANGRPDLALFILAETTPPEAIPAEGLLLWAELCLELGYLPCARHQYERVLTLDPTNEAARTALDELNQ